MFNAIDPVLVRGWVIIRTWPELDRRFPSPIPRFDYLEIWGWHEHARLQWCGDEEKVYDGYIGSHCQQFRHHITIFRTYEEADTVVMIMEPRWPDAKFLILPI